jgi:hypothetical protein
MEVRVSLAQVRDLIREAVESGRVRFTRHAMEEMAKDRLTVVDMGAVLKGCAVTRVTRRDARSGSWVYEANGSTEDGKRVAMQLGVPEGVEEPMVSIVTVWGLK